MRLVASALLATIVVPESLSPSKAEAKNLAAPSKKLDGSKAINLVLAFLFWRFAVKADVEDAEMAVATNAVENFMIAVMFCFSSSRLYV